MNKRCSWVNLNNPRYVSYHDHEWCKPSYDDAYLFEMLLLESFQAGLSWECILNKRDAFRDAFDQFDYHKIACYDEEKIQELMNNPLIVRNRLKISATIMNAKVFLKIQEEYGSFSQYIWSFTNYEVIYHKNNEVIVSNELSDQISDDLKKRGMKFVGTTIIYSYLQAIGVVNDHEKECYLFS
ncbi:MAG: DNA-3-methyladenine glycosylase I [Bacilli bacterium]|nr:DNA-3-methyladenine glycosylase I [Bacilli bacterium]